MQLEKAKVRRQALEIRNGLEQNYRAQCSGQIMERLFHEACFGKAKIVLSYASIRSEVETGSLNREVLRRGKQLYLPKTYARSRQMRFFRVEELSDLKEGYQGILEPEETVAAESLFDGDGSYTKEEILMVMPGVAFDQTGCRMGYGGGYYDRYVEKYGGQFTCLLIAFDEQQRPVIPTEQWDARPAYIVTQSGVRKNAPGNRHDRAMGRYHRPEIRK